MAKLHVELEVLALWELTHYTWIKNWWNMSKCFVELSSFALYFEELAEIKWKATVADDQWKSAENQQPSQRTSIILIIRNEVLVDEKYQG